jgi:hypothetical protein
MTLRRSKPYWARKVGGSLPYTPPLDVFNNSIAAFSVRKVRTLYTGPCIRIAGIATPANQLDIGFDSDGLIDTAAISAFVDAQGAQVATWYDQSGNGLDISCSANNSRPFARKGATVSTMDGKFAVDYTSFGGVGNSTMFLKFAAKINPASFFLVGKNDAYGAANYIGFSGADNDGAFTGGTFGGVNGLGILQNNATRVQNNTENLIKRLWAFFGGSTDKVYTDGVNEATAGTAFPNPFILEIGRTIANGGAANLTMNGKLQEYLFFSDDKIASKAAIEANLNSYYTIY